MVKCFINIHKKFLNVKHPNFNDLITNIGADHENFTPQKLGAML